VKDFHVSFKKEFKNASVARWHSDVHNVIGKKYLLAHNIVTTSLRKASQVKNSRNQKVSH